MTVQLLGFQEFIPPFATSRGQEILKGVNYASGSAGILNESGQHLVNLLGSVGMLFVYSPCLSIRVSNKSIFKLGRVIEKAWTCS